MVDNDVRRLQWPLVGLNRLTWPKRFSLYILQMLCIMFWLVIFHGQGTQDLIHGWHLADVENTRFSAKRVGDVTPFNVRAVEIGLISTEISYADAMHKCIVIEVLQENRYENVGLQEVRFGSQESRLISSVKTHSIQQWQDSSAGSGTR